jgi:hypothetical protein
MHFLLAYFSFLFSCAPLCAIYLEGSWFVATSFLQDHHFPTDPAATSCVKKKIGVVGLRPVQVEIRTIYQAQHTLYVYIHHVYILDIHSI